MANVLRDFKGSRIGWLGVVLILWIVLVVAGLLQAPRGAGGGGPRAPHDAGATLESRGSHP